MTTTRWVAVHLALLLGCSEGVIEGKLSNDGDVVAEFAPTSDGGVGLPCDVRSMLENKCGACHGRPLAGNAPFSLQTRDDLIAPSPFRGQTQGQRALARMLDSTSPMPPEPRTVSGDDIAVLDTWLFAGSTESSCDGFTPGPAPTTCGSDVFWRGGTQGSSDMNPGLACRACHLGQNFDGQNPRGVRDVQRAYTFMGTLFPSLNEKNLCDARVPAGVVVEILDNTGAVALTFSANGPDGVIRSNSGNFYSNNRARAVALPYTARVRAGAKMLSMTTPQTDGDCNTCHTEQGLNGAPGRIVWPR